MVQVKVQPGRFGAPTRRIALQDLGETRRFRRGTPVVKKQVQVRRVDTAVTKQQLQINQAERQEISRLDIQKTAAQTELARLKARKASGVVKGRGSRDTLTAMINEKVAEIRAINSVTNRLKQGQVFAAGNIDRFVERTKRGAKTKTLENISERGKLELSPVRQLEVFAKLARGEGAKVIQIAERGTLSKAEFDLLKPRERAALGVKEEDFVEVQAAEELPGKQMKVLEEAPPAPGAGVAFAAESIRKRQSEIQTARGRRKLTAGERAEAFALGGIGAGVGFVSAIVSPIDTARALGNFGTTTASRFVKGDALFPEITAAALRSPERFTGQVVGEVILTKGLQAPIKLVTNIGEQAFTRLDLGFKPIKKADGAGGVVGVIEDVKIGGDFIDIPALGGLQNINVPIREQFRQAGQTRNLVTAQRDLFGTVRRQELTVEKPLQPGESPLERSIFFDPGDATRPAGLRLSRLAQPEQPAGFLDIISGDFAFGGQRPQAVVLAKQKISKLPKNLADVESALKKGKTLTPDQQKRFLRFQLKVTGEAKPLGFPGTLEPEVTLPPGTILRKKRTAGVTLAKTRAGTKRVSIIEAEIVKQSRKLLDLEKKRVKGTALKSDLAAIDDLIRKESRGLSQPSRRTGTIKRAPRPVTALRGGSRVTTTRRTATQRDVTRLQRLDRQVRLARPSRPARVGRQSRTARPSLPIRSPTARLTVPRLTPPRVTTPRPRTPTPPIKLPDVKEKRIRRQDGAFDVFVGQGAKKKKIANDLPFNKALKRGATFVQDNIEATFTLRKDPGKKPKGKDIRFDLNNEVFRKSRRPNAPALRFVERKNKRLSTGKEVTQINRARRKLDRMIP